MADLHMDPDVVDRCGAELTAQGTSVRAAGDGFTASAVVVDRHGALASASALGDCRNAWGVRIADDGNTATSSGAAFRSAVQEYLATDGHSAAQFRGY